MDYNRIVDQSLVDYQKMYVGNKIVRLEYMDEMGSICSYYDISITKDLFQHGENNVLFALTDCSHFQMLEKLTNVTAVFQPYRKLHLFEPMISEKYYVTHLFPIWKYMNSIDFESAILFLQKYNQKLSQMILKKIQDKQIMLADIRFVRKNIFNNEDCLEIISVIEENLLQALVSIQGPVRNYQKQLSKPFFKL